MWRDVRGRRQLARPPGLRVRRAGVAARQGPRARPQRARVLNRSRTRRSGPWLAALSGARARASSCSTPTPTSGRTTPTGSRAPPRSCSRGWTARAAPAARCSRCRSRTATRRERHGHRRGRRLRRHADRRTAASTPHADPLAEAERCLAAGAAGIKLHPRAEDFPLDTPELEPRVRARGRAPAAGARARRPRHPGAGPPRARRDRAPPGTAADPRPLRASATWPGSGARRADHPNLFFDTAWWAPATCSRCSRWSRPGHILFASDAPYGTPAFAATLHLRYALQAGLTDDQVRLAFGGQMARILAGEEPADAGPAPGPGALDRDPLLDRVHTFLTARDRADVQRRGADRGTGADALACKVDDDAPQAEICADGARSAGAAAAPGRARVRATAGPTGSRPGCL